MRIYLLLPWLLLTGAVHADRLVDSRPIARGDFLGPRFAPDGRELLVTKPQLRGLYLVPRSGGAVRELTADAEAGVHARWTANGTIAYRAQRAGTRRDLEIDRAGRVQVRMAPAPVAFSKDDRMYVERAGKLVRIGSGDRFFGEVVSPDGDKVVFQGLTTGLHVYTRSTGALVHIGPGTAPAWSPDSRRIAFEITEDDGHAVVASELYLYELATDRALPLTFTDRVIERRPSFSPSGAELAFDDDDGTIYVATLEVRP